MDNLITAAAQVAVDELSVKLNLGLSSYEKSVAVEVLESKYFGLLLALLNPNNGSPPTSAPAQQKAYPEIFWSSHPWHSTMDSCV